MHFEFFNRNHVLVALIGLLFMAGCKLGRKEPSLGSAGFSADGKVLAYTYSDIFITQYFRRGNQVRQQGIISYYLALIETSSGEKLLSKPYKTKMMIEVLYNDGENVWLQSLDTRKGKTGLAIFNIPEKKMRFTAEDLNRLNPGIVLDANSNIFVDKEVGRIIAVATDGRYYSVDAKNAKCTLLQSKDLLKLAATSKIKKGTGMEPFYAPILLSQLVQSFDDYQAPVAQRGPLTKGHELISKETFLEAGFVLAKPAFGSVTHNELMDYKAHIFVCSKVTTDNEKDLMLTMVRLSDLSSVWTVALPALSREQNSYHKPYFKLLADTLYVVNSSHLMTIDVQSGKLIATQLLFKH